MTYDIKELHQTMLGILVQIDEMCARHGLTYYLTAGTMLGAVRHKGFIPWDDDADICMPRPDYEKLIAHAKEWLPERYELICAENDNHFYVPFAKIQDAETTLIERKHLGYLGGVYVDVFPVDAVPDSSLARRLHIMRYKWLRKKLYFTFRDPYRHGHGPSSWPSLLCRKLYTVAGLQLKIRQLLLKYDYEKADLVQDYNDGHGAQLPKRIFGKPTDYTFEGHTLKGYECYDEYLTTKYGDYLTPPDEAHQWRHEFYYVDLHSPYRQYQGPEKPAK